MKAGGRGEGNGVKIDFMIYRNYSYFCFGCDVILVIKIWMKLIEFSEVAKSLVCGWSFFEYFITRCDSFRSKGFGTKVEPSR